MHNVLKWTGTLQKSCKECCKIFKVCLTILGRYALKGYETQLTSFEIKFFVCLFPKELYSFNLTIFGGGNVTFCPNRIQEYSCFPTNLLRTN